MAGSLKDFEYTTDSGSVFAINLDESNTEAVNGATGDYTDTSTAIFRLPGNIVPRRAYYSSPTGDRVIQCVVLTQAIYNALAATTPTIIDPLDAGGTATLRLTRIRPEMINRLPRPDDTGLTDGDAT